MPVKLSVKKGVRFDADHPALGRMLAELLLLDYDGEIVITAGTNGTHMSGSKHYSGQAIDIRVHNLPSPEAIAKKLRDSLGPRFTVLHESPNTPNAHLHVQVRKGTIYT